MNEVVTSPAAWEFSAWKKGQVTVLGCAASAQGTKQDVVLCVTTREALIWEGNRLFFNGCAILKWN